MDQNELNKMMHDIFGTAKQNQEDEKFYLYYNNFGKILSMSANPIEDYKEEAHTFIDREKFLELQDVNLNNYIIDTSKDPVDIVDISGDLTRKSLKLSKVNPELWNIDRMVTLQFIKDTRTLKIKIKNQLPAQRRLWVVPKGMYMIQLADIKLFSATEQDYHIPPYKNINSCEIVTQSDLNIFTAYRELENEKDLLNK
tara:strand:+ start:40 stop:633 length:594 start_codon:yes stop_codon:yes gene_type:complete